MMDEMQELHRYRENLLERYGSVVAQICEVTRALPPEALHNRLLSGGFTAHQTLVHLRDIEAHALAPRLRKMLTEENPAFELFDDLGWLEAHYKPDEPVEKILAELETLRAQEMEWMVGLPSAGWNRTARHPWFGPRTFQWWVERCLLYSEEHLQLLLQARNLETGSAGLE